MARLKIQCLVCQEETIIGEKQIDAEAYRCPCCGLEMNDYQWALCRGVYFTVLCAELKRKNPVEVRLFTHSCIFDDL